MNILHKVFNMKLKILKKLYKNLNLIHSNPDFSVKGLKVVCKTAE